MFLFLPSEQSQQLLSIFILLPFISLTILFFCSKSRPSKDLADAPPQKKKVASKLKKEEVKAITPKSKKQPSKKNAAAAAASAKEPEVKKFSSKETEEKKNSHENLLAVKASKTASSDDVKKGAPPVVSGVAATTGPKGSNETNVKPSEHVASELRKGNKPSGMKGSHEIHPVTAAGKKKGSHDALAGGSKDKVPNEYDLHRSQTPAIFPAEDEDKDKKTNFTGSILEYNNFGTDEDGGHFKKATTENSNDEKLKKTLKPRVFEKNEKEKRIVAGEKRKSSEYPTMADVLSDWTDHPKSQQIPDSLLSKKVEPI